MSEILTTYGQSVADIAIQEYGAIEGVFALMIDNDVEDLSEVFEPSKPLEIREKLILNNQNLTIVEMMKLENVGRVIGNANYSSMGSKSPYVDEDYVEVDYILEL
jgi:hypothetical protein